MSAFEVRINGQYGVVGNYFNFNYIATVANDEVTERRFFSDASAHFVGTQEAADMFWDGVFDVFSQFTDDEDFVWDIPVDFIYVTDGANLSQPVILREGDVFSGPLASGLALERIVTSNISTVNNQYFMWRGIAMFSGELVVRGDLILSHNTMNWHEFHPYQSDWQYFPRIVNDMRDIWFVLYYNNALFEMLGFEADEVEDYSDTIVTDITILIRNYTIQSDDGAPMNLAEIVRVFD